MLLEKFFGDLREERVTEDVLVGRVEETFVDKFIFELREGLALCVFDGAVVDDLVFKYTLPKNFLNLCGDYRFSLW